MKYRSDFVTNSSSSSFIVAFRNKEDMKEQFKKMAEKYPMYSHIVFQDIADNRKTYTEIVNYLKERLKWEARYYIRYEMPEYREKKYNIDWLDSAEYKKVEKEYIDNELNKFKDNVNHRGIFAKVTYSDHTDSELEHYIMPNMPFVVKVISNH